ncbi:MAG: Uroporphyrinogen-III synthase (EC [uncultured Sulfurovum sp.]|uniref:Uroporphyrinogen-III synthase (EC) n=1 Tax=uncultured Sulfurovum sp. TaxID=269237 RepID=A0A6S6TXB1_9BACT|nr:MAG: Uroporphyrinogen-III synthase (EC [uncultured Sulfurovum sp.]
MQRLIYLLSPLNREETLPLPMISFALSTEFIDFSACDIVMFTSKQAVVSANEIDASWKNYPCIAIGVATKKKIESLGGKVIYAPKDFYAETLNHEIVEKFSDKKLLYLRPKEVSFDSKAYLAKHEIFLSEKILYETSCLPYSKDKKPKKNAIIIFTSPSTIKCFFKSFQWDKSYVAVIIGLSTKKHLPKYCSYRIADEPTIDACIAKALHFKDEDDLLSN